MASVVAATAVAVAAVVVAVVAAMAVAALRDVVAYTRMLTQGSDPCNWSSVPHVQGAQGQGFSLGFFVLFYFVVLIALQS